MKGTRRHHRSLGISALTLAIAIALSLKFMPWSDTPPEPIQSSAAPTVISEQHTDPAPKRVFASAQSATTPTLQDGKAMFPDTEAGRRLTAHWQVATTPRRTAAEADREYQQSIRELRKDAASSARLLREAYWNTPEEHQESRFIHASTLGDLESDEALEPLREIATDPIMPERFEDPHAHSSQSEERVIRMVAVDGLAALAKAGNADADEMLLEIATNSAYDDQRGTRIRAIRGYLAAGPDTLVRAKTLRDATPESLHWAISLRQPTRDDVYASLPPGESLQ
jgi:hypothetical protein